MAYENLCMYCFEDRGGQATCPHCGRDNHAAVPQIQMLPGTLVYHDRFLIGRALGQDATGIVYAALDTKKENKLRIREYLPRDCAERLNDGGVVPIAGLEDKYDAGIRKLRASIEDEEDPRRRHFFFEENGTAYIVQRRPSSASAPQSSEDDGKRHKHRDEDEGGRGRTVIIALIAAIAVVGAAAALFMVFGGNMLHPQDVTETPTMDPAQVWLPSDSPTVTPYTSPTFAALVDPDLSWMDYDYQTIDLGGAAPTGNTGAAGSRGTATARPTATPRPTPVPTLSGSASGYTNINTRSGASEIRQLQQRLVTLGWLDYTKITGKYDADTRAAVRDFQRYINTSYDPAPKLQVDGIAGPKTQQWLYQVNAARPTATPTQRPTATPKPRVTAPPDDDTVVDENSSAKKIRAMQRELILLGVLPEGTDSGKYDATTRSAVKRFQNRVNQLQGYEVLESTGRMDALSMAFLDYYVDEWRAIQTATATPEPAVTATPAPTATPTAAITPTPAPADVVNRQSSPEAIIEVQRRLIAIGMLPEGVGTGVYDGETQSAVAAFQQWVNQRRGEQTLSVTGEADLLTRTYLKYCQDNNLRPSVAATTPPVSIPTDTPEPTPQVIDRTSDREAIRNVQQRLADVGLLGSGSVDGVFGQRTANAVRSFQAYVNAHGGNLEVSGVVDSATLSELERYAASGLTADGSADATAEPTEAPTAEPTGAPTPVPTVIPDEDEAPYMDDDVLGDDENVNEDVNVTIDEGSEEDSIRYVQMMLSNIGALSEDDVTGVYDAATRQAVARFQSWVNSQGASELDVTGTVDDNTRRLLEYASDNDLSMDGGGQIQQSEPIEQPEADAQSAAMRIVIDGKTAGSDPVAVGDESFNVQWSAGDNVTGYNVYLFNSAGDVMNSRLNTRETGFKVAIEQMIPGEIYTLTVGAIPRGGDEDDILWQTSRFVRPVQATPEPTDTPEPRPSVGVVKAPKIVISGGESHDGVTLITEENFRIAWNAEGEVSGYDVQIADSEGNEITSQSGIAQTEISIRTASMQSGVVYTISVGAVPVNGGSENTLWSRASFMRPAIITPEPTAAPTFTPEPTATPETIATPAPTPAPVVAEAGRPSVNVGGSGYQQDGVQYMTDSTIIISWVAEGDVANYIIYVENQAGERLSLGTTTDTSRTVTTSNLPAGVYTVYIGAVPLNGTQEDAQWGTARFGIPTAVTPEPRAEVTPEPAFDDDYPENIDSYDPGDDVSQPSEAGADPLAPIDSDTDSDTVLRLQRQLYRLGVMAGEPEQGVLDSVTLQAVAEFQSRANDQYGAGLMVIDPGSPNAVIDSATLTWIERGL